VRCVRTNFCIQNVWFCALLFPFLSHNLLLFMFPSQIQIKSHSLRNQYVPPKLANGSSSPKTPHSPKKTLVSFFKRSSTAESLPRPASVNSTTNANTANNSVSNNVSTNGATQNIPFGSSNGNTAVVMTDNASFDHRSTLGSSQPTMRNKIDSDNVSVFSGNDVMTGRDNCSLFCVYCVFSVCCVCFLCTNVGILFCFHLVIFITSS